MRHLTKTLAVVSFLLPASAYPLGIGEIKLHSALNQNLDAEIALVLSPGEKPADIKVSLASPDKFDETGIPWSYFLSKLRFQTIDTGNNRVLVKITSKDVLKEPFLDFLLQVSWPKGDLYREFTVLVDPPSEYEEESAPVITSSSAIYAPAQQYYKKPTSKPHKTRVKISADINSDRYGPTVKNDSLGKIAQNIPRDPDVSMEQLMIALYDANPGAFFKANINALLAGRTLKVPKKEEILKLSRNDAFEEFNRQMQAWKNPSAVSRIAPQPEESVVEKTAENQLTLSAPAQDAVLDSGSPLSANKANNNQGAVAKPVGDEQKSATNPVDDAISSKIAALEKQLATMQQLISLKDEQLTALQNQAQSKSITPSAPPLSEKGVTETLPQQPVEPFVSQAKIEGDSGKVTTVVPPPVSAKPEAQQVPAQPPSIQTPTIKRVSPPVPVQEDSSIWSYLGFEIAGIGLLGALGWYWQKKRKNIYDDLLLPDFPSRNKGVERFVNAENMDNDESSLASDNLFVSEINSGEFDVFDMDQTEIDPISEADVYLAYGRYQQAEDLMRHAIEEQPLRDEFKLKLLEIFYANENKKSFENYAEELIDQGKIDDTVFWSKVTVRYSPLSRPKSHKIKIEAG